jgi:hypothetical protein
MILPVVRATDGQDLLDRREALVRLQYGVQRGFGTGLAYAVMPAADSTTSPSLRRSAS